MQAERHLPINNMGACGQGCSATGAATARNEITIDDLDTNEVSCLLSRHECGHNKTSLQVYGQLLSIVILRRSRPETVNGVPQDLPRSAHAWLHIRLSIGLFNREDPDSKCSSASDPRRSHSLLCPFFEGPCELLSRNAI